jgi:hypothetical protein
VTGTFGSLLVSYFVWWFWGMGFCGEETYDSPPGSTADALCQALVRPVWPWALLAATPPCSRSAAVSLASCSGCRVSLAFRSWRRWYLVSLTFFLVPALF